jgi:type IV pilus assembly protein PilW
VKACRRHQAGHTLVELMVALAIASFLIVGAVQIYNQSRQAFMVNESIARVQETAQFAVDTIEADLRMASNWGRTSRSLNVQGRSVAGNVNPGLLPAPTDCGTQWVLDLALAVDGHNNAYDLACPAVPVAQIDSDVITIRRASVNPAPLTPGRLQVQSTRVRGALFADGNMPASFSLPDSATHNLLVNSYYVAADSDLIPGVPTLRRKTLTTFDGAPSISDQEVAPGVENLQIQLGIDLDQDNTVDRYVNPGDPAYNPNSPGYLPGARVLTARIWLIVRGISPEIGIQQARGFEPADVDLGVPTDNYRRMQVSKTILLRNARS